MIRTNTETDMLSFKERNLREALAKDDGGWTKHTHFHWSRDVGGERLDFWPTTLKYKYRGEFGYGDIEKVSIIIDMGEV